MTARSIPTLASGQCSVLCVEGDTGVVLNLSGQRAMRDEVAFRVFNDEAEAVEWARQTIAKSPLWECVIYNSDAVRIRVVNNPDAVVAHAGSRKPPSWWDQLRQRIRLSK